jgi:Fe2+ transport system protein FeoA
VRNKWPKNGLDPDALNQRLYRPLSQVRAGLPVRIKRLQASPEVNQRLREMGFSEDQQVRVVLQSSHLICQINSARLGLSLGVAEAIWVEPLPLVGPLV